MKEKGIKKRKKGRIGRKDKETWAEMELRVIPLPALRSRHVDFVMAALIPRRTISVQKDGDDKTAMG